MDIKEAYKKRDHLMKELEKWKNLIKAIRAVCDHDFVYDGHDSHKDHYKCSKCDETDTI